MYKRQGEEYSRPIDFGENQLRESGGLLATFYVITSLIFSMTNDNCRKFKHNQIRFAYTPKL